MSFVAVAAVISAIGVGYSISATKTANTRAKDQMKAQDAQQRKQEKELQDRIQNEKANESQAILRQRQLNARRGAAGGTTTPSSGTTLGIGSARGQKTTLGL